MNDLLYGKSIVILKALLSSFIHCFLHCFFLCSPLEHGDSFFDEDDDFDDIENDAEPSVGKCTAVYEFECKLLFFLLHKNSSVQFFCNFLL